MNILRTLPITLLLIVATVTTAAQADTFKYRVFADGVRAPVENISAPAPVVADAAIGTLTADTSADFGAVTLNASATRGFTFRNTGTIAATGVFAAISQTTGLSILSNSCGTLAAPVTVARNSSCTVYLGYGGATASSLSGASLSVGGAFTGSPQSIPLSGTTGNFNATAAWSSTYATGGASLTTADVSYGTRTTGSSMYKTFYLRNTGTNGAQSVGLTLTGDTSYFKITTVRTNYSNSYFLDSCQGPGFQIAADGLSSTPCKAYDIAGGSYPLIVVNVTYVPTAIGNHSITITPSTNNGTVLPGAITLTGRGEFNPAAVWSSTYATAGASLTAADVSYGAKTTGTVASKTFYLRNTGSNGAQSVGLKLTGDTSYFKITSVRPNYSNSYFTDSCQGTGFQIAPDGLSSTPCKAYDIAGGSYPFIVVTVTYSPTAVGNHSITITPSTNNGTILPGAITLTGTGQ
jgi:hypothetical protein